MHVREWGLPRRPLVFWHALGAAQSGAYLTELAPTLTEAGLRLIAPDAPGFGQSPPLPPGALRARFASRPAARRPDGLRVEQAS